MSFSLPSRRLLRSASTLPTTLPPSRALSTTPSRPWFWSRKKAPESPAPANPFEQSITGSASDRAGFKQRLKSASDRRKSLEDDFRNSTADRLSSPAIFDDIIDTPAPGPKEPMQKRRTDKKRGPPTPWATSQVREHYARAVDPDPRSRVRWERKMVIRRVHAGTDAFSREPREARLKRTERESRAASGWLPTSVKKLGKLARQVAGKPVAEALTQMRYSKKKMAREVRVELEKALELAVVARGMGLGAPAPADGKKREPVRIKTKDGKWIDVDDPTRVYIAQAFVNRGPWRYRQMVPASRGRAFINLRPATSINFVLKEEKTRIREHQEREAKVYRQGPWIHLPDRPVTAQRQHYSW